VLRHRKRSSSRRATARTRLEGGAGGASPGPSSETVELRLLAERGRARSGTRPDGVVKTAAREESGEAPQTRWRRHSRLSPSFSLERDPTRRGQGCSVRAGRGGRHPRRGLDVYAVGAERFVRHCTVFRIPALAGGWCMGKVRQSSRFESTVLRPARPNCRGGRATRRRSPGCTPTQRRALGKRSQRPREHGYCLARQRGGALRPGDPGGWRLRVRGQGPVDADRLQRRLSPRRTRCSPRLATTTTDNEIR